MLKKTITSVDFDGNERTEDYYFNITKSEITKAQLSHDGGLTVKLDRIVKAQSVPDLIAAFEFFVDLSYGVKSDNGKYFKKTKEDLEEFKSSAAYDVLFMELISDTKAAIAFITGILPPEISSQIGNDAEINKKLEEITNK